MTDEFVMHKFALFLFFISFNSAAWPIKEQILFTENDPVSEGKNARWTKLAEGHKQSINILLEVLKKSPSAKKIIDQAEIKAAKAGKNLVDLIHPGEHSITDTTLIRHFSVSDPLSVTYETKSQVFLNTDHNIEDALLDLAHELVHFVHKEAFNPYGENFDFRDFLRSTLEGRGGEVQAYLHECAVMSEIMRSRFLKDENCQKVYFPTNKDRSTERGRDAFYQLGEFKSIFLEEIQQFQLSGDNFPHISGREASFISSAYGLPYPLASLREFKQIMSRVCRNDQERYKYLGRSPTSVGDRLRKDLDKRCSPFLAIHEHHENH